MSLTALPPLPHVYHRSRPEQETQEAEFLGVRNPVGFAAYVPPSVGFTLTEGRGDSHPVSREGSRHRQRPRRGHTGPRRRPRLWPQVAHGPGGHRPLLGGSGETQRMGTVTAPSPLRVPGHTSEQAGLCLTSASALISTGVNYWDVGEGPKGSLQMRNLEVIVCEHGRAILTQSPRVRRAFAGTQIQRRVGEPRTKLPGERSMQEIGE